MSIRTSVTCRWRRMVWQTGTVWDKPRSGRPRSTTQREERYPVLWPIDKKTYTDNNPRGQLQIDLARADISDPTIMNRQCEKNIFLTSSGEATFTASPKGSKGMSSSSKDTSSVVFCVVHLRVKYLYAA